MVAILLSSSSPLDEDASLARSFTTRLNPVAGAATPRRVRLTAKVTGTESDTDVVGSEPGQLEVGGEVWSGDSDTVEGVHCSVVERFVVVKVGMEPAVDSC